ncbi:MAG: hypothetical protein HUK14_10940 [Muribaculaceae bacterium]|nr:hypothetical protein [Muribaculaceae bacterium]
MKKVLILFIYVCTLSLHSCYTTKTVDHFVSVVDDLKKQFGGKTKSYIIENYPYSATDIKRLDDQYEILIFERHRNDYVGDGITRFHLKNGVCYKIETNEYKIEKRKEKVRVL